VLRFMIPVPLPFLPCAAVYSLAMRLPVGFSSTANK
jgi:hypothetical protein